MDKYIVVNDLHKHELYTKTGIGLPLQVGIYDKQNPQLPNAQIPIIIAPPLPDKNDMEPLPNKEGIDDQIPDSKNPTVAPDGTVPGDDKSSGSAAVVVLVLLIIFALIGIFACSYGKQCLENVRTMNFREAMNATFASQKPPNVSERENMI